ncbi:hypothetical protein [Nostoc sp.]|uniref:hypothetical protein n=1 Tax=Nostoc sp. TaxID=1180 RepID=UPI00359407C4
MLIALLAVAGIVYISSLNWHHSVKAVFIILVVEGALRKWVLPQASEMIYFLKDFVILGAYINYYFFSLAEKKLAFKNFTVNILISFVAIWSLFQVFNPSLGSPLVGMFGLRGYLFYIPLMWLIPSLFQSESELYKFLRSHLLLLIPVGILGIAQFFSPPSSPLNVYANNEASAVTFAGINAVRVTGTFSYISGYSVYLLVCFGLLIFFLSINQSRWWRLLSICELFLVTVNSLMTGSRGVILASVLFLICYLGVKGFTQPASTLRLLRQLLLPVIVVAIAAFIWFRPAVDAFSLRTTSNQDVSERISGSFTQPFEFIKYKELDGYGTGATHQAAPALRKVLGLPAGEFIPVGYESEMGRVALELGPIGFLLWYGLRVSIFIALWSVFWKLKSPFLRQLALSAFLIQVIQLNGQLVFHHTFSVYYWFLSSFIFLLPRLEQIENWHQKQQLLQEDVLSTYITDSPYR